MDRRQFVASTCSLIASAALPGLARPAKSSLDKKWYQSCRRFAELPMGRVAYVEKGHGSHVALFLHGFPLNGFQWRGSLGQLARYRRCIAPDFLGMGYSEVARDHRLTPTAQAEMLASFLDSLRIRAVDIVANDAGGLVAQLFIALFPDRVRSLLLSNCDVDTNNPPKKFMPAVTLAKRGLFAERYIAPQLADKQFARSVRGIGGQYTYPEMLADSTIEAYFLPLVSSSVRKAQLDEYTVALGGNVLVPIRGALSRWNKPARFLWATRDIFFGVERADWLDRTLPGSRGVRRLEDANLFFPKEMPDVVVEEARLLWAAR